MKRTKYGASSMVFAFDDLVNALVGDAESLGKCGLRFASFIAGADEAVAFLEGKGRARRLLKQSVDAA